MTMQIEIKNTSTIYTGKVTEVDVSDDGREIGGAEHILKPGQDVSLCAYQGRILKVEEVGEIKA